MKILKLIKNKIGPSKDYKIRNIKVKNININILYNEVLTNSFNINELILKQLMKLTKKELENLKNNIPYIEIKTIKKNEILNNLNNGSIIIFIKQKIYSIEIKEKIERSIQEIKSELSLTGPKDSFSEGYNTNIALIRKRIKSEELFIENIYLGRYTNTKIGILYINKLANNNLINKIKKLLNKIDIDGIIDSSYLKRKLETNKNLFPTIMMTERPDKVAMSLLEGKIAIVCDMSPYVLILPCFLIDFFHTTDDYYQKAFNVSFIRLIRLCAFIIAIFTPGIYIATTTRNYDLLSYNLLIMLKSGRSFVPFPAYIEALFMIICFEILKESDIRMSSTTGSAISILGGLILGDAAVAAGIVSPIMIIIIAISSISGLIFSSLELGNALRTYKILILILATLLGIYGVIIGAIYLIINLITLKSFNIKYLSPIIPFDKNEISDSIIKINKKIMTRNKQLTKNIIKGRDI